MGSDRFTWELRSSDDPSSLAEMASLRAKLNETERELLELRSAKRADEERIRAVVREQIRRSMEELGISENGAFGREFDAIASRVAAQLAGSLGEQVTEMRMCEANRLVLHPGQLYRFTVAPGCERCAADDLLSAIRSVLDNDDLPAGQLRAELRRIVGGA